MLSQKNMSQNLKEQKSYNFCSLTARERYWGQKQKLTSLWKVNNTILNTQEIKEEITRKIRKYFQTTENDNTTYQNFWQATKAVIRKSYTRGINVKKEEISQ